MNLVCTNIEGRSNVAESVPLTPSDVPTPLLPHQVRHTVTPGGVRLKWDPIDCCGAALSRLTVYVSHVPHHNGEAVVGGGPDPWWVTLVREAEMARERDAAAIAAARGDDGPVQPVTVPDGPRRAVDAGVVFTLLAPYATQLGVPLDEASELLLSDLPPLRPHPCSMLAPGASTPVIRLRSVFDATGSDHSVDEAKGVEGEPTSPSSPSAQVRDDTSPSVASPASVKRDLYAAYLRSVLGDAILRDPDDVGDDEVEETAEEKLQRLMSAHREALIQRRMSFEPEYEFPEHTDHWPGVDLDPTATSHTFEPLVSGDGYWFCIEAENVRGVTRSVIVGPVIPQGTHGWMARCLQTISPASTRSDRPDPVRAPVSERLDQGLRVTWDVPANCRGALVTHYDVSVFLAASATHVAESKGVPAHERHVDIYGLRNSFAYLASVVAVNHMGPSDPGIAPHQIPAGVPRPPKEVAVEASHDSDGRPAALVRFSHAAPNGREVLRYFINAVATRWNEGRNRGGEDSVLLRMLTSDQAVAGSDPLLIQQAERDAAAVGSQVGSCASSVNSGDEAAGDAIDAGLGFEWNDSAESGSNDHLPLLCLLPGLELGAYYRFRVWAENEVGVGERSEWSKEMCAIGRLCGVACALVTTCIAHAYLPGIVDITAVPTAPTNVSATAGHREADVSWDAPRSDGGAAVTEYIIVPTRVDGKDAGGSVRVPGSARGVRMTSLVNGVQYTFTVRAVNAAGIGERSTPTAVIETTLGMFSPSRVAHIVSAQSRRRGKQWYQGYTKQLADQVGVCVLGKQHAKGVALEDSDSASDDVDAGTTSEDEAKSSKDCADDIAAKPAVAGKLAEKLAAALTRTRRKHRSKQLRPKFEHLHVRESNVELGASPYSPASWGYHEQQ